MSRKLKTAGFVLLFLSGAVGGGSLFLDILEHYHAPDILCDIVGLVYFCAFCLVFSKVQLKEEAEENEERIRQEGYDAGFAAGSEEGFIRGFNAGESYQRKNHGGEPCPPLKNT